MMKQRETVAVIGVGLIGGSIGLGLLGRRLARRVVGIGRRESTLEMAKARSAVTETTTDLAAGVAEAELIVVCTPVCDIVEKVREAAKHAPTEAVITDAGSIKGAIVAALDDLGDGPAFVGSHPMAGSEKSGPAFADADLFVDRLAIVTPSEKTRATALAEVEEFWRSLGARVRRMGPEGHDAAVAAVSHMPHVVASALAAATPEDLLPLAASGWWDTTRVAAGEIELWRQILSENRGHVLRSLEEFEKTLASFREALARGDDAELVRLLEQGKSRRDAVGN
jgi:prephenate dehydrogenase